MSNLEALRSMLTVTETDTDMDVKLGWMTVAHITEEDGEWFVTMRGDKLPLDSMGWVSKEEALGRLVKYLTLDS
jgi:hypothetical protein